MSKLNLMSLFNTPSNEPVPEEVDLSAMFAEASVNGETPPTVPSRLYLAHDDNKTEVKGPHLKWMAVSPKLHEEIKAMRLAIKSDRYLFRSIRTRHGRRRSWSATHNIAVAVSSKSFHVFVKVYDNEAYEGRGGNRTIKMGKLDRYRWIELKKEWEQG